MAVGIRWEDLEGEEYARFDHLVIPIAFSGLLIGTEYQTEKNILDKIIFPLIFCPGIQDSKTVFDYEVRQNLRPVNIFKTAW